VALMPISSRDLRGLVKSFPWDEWQKQLAPGFLQVYRDAVIEQGTAAAEDHDVTFDASDPFLQEHMTSYVGERITQLDEVTQQAVTSRIQQALADGEDLEPNALQESILDTVDDLFDDMSASRALRIARTEAAIVYNHGNTLGFAQAGFEEVDVIDGTDDDECADANGAVWSIDDALDDPLGHPNCTRQFAPHVDVASSGDDSDDSESEAEADAA
jgi:hypothetical protein